LQGRHATRKDDVEFWGFSTQRRNQSQFDASPISTLSSISSIQPFVRPKQSKECHKNEKQKPEILEAFAEKYRFQIASDLSQEQRYELLNVLYEFKDTFALEITDIKIHQ